MQIFHNFNYHDQKPAMNRILLAAIFLAFVTISRAQSYLPRWNDSRVKVETLNLGSYAFNLSDVELLESPFKEAMQVTAAYLLKVEPDRLLSQFRSNAGLEPKGEIYGGWESAGLAGHSLGHYLSSCSMYYAVSKDTRYLERVNYIVEQLEETQKARGTGYVGAIPNEDSVWAEVKKGNITARDFYLNGAWSPFYTLHKIMAGLLDAYLYTDNQKALEINIGIADWTGDLISGLSDSLRWKMLICEYGGMNETLANTYAFTGNKKYLELSRKFQDHHILDSLGMEKNVLPGKHSNTQIPKVIGSARRYELTGNSQDIVTTLFFWNVMVNMHSYANGGNSNYERLSAPGRLNDELTDNTTETCNTYNMLKLTTHVFAISPMSWQMDYYERALYNHILASQNPNNGMVCYFVPLRMGSRKRYSNEFNNFTCCHGSGMENHVKYGEAIYSHSGDGKLFINLFIPSKLSWHEKGVIIHQDTKFPEEDKVRIRIEAERSISFPILIRRPEWVTDNFRVSINGKEIKEYAGSGNGYLHLEQKWKSGDEIIVELPMKLYSEPMPDNPNRVALFYGPVLLAGNFGETEPDPEIGIPSFITGNPDVETWLDKRDEKSLLFSTGKMSDSSKVNLIPFYETIDEFYSVYWDVYHPIRWKEELRRMEDEKQRKLNIENRTIDMLIIGDKESEERQRFEGVEVRTGENHRKSFIRTNRNGSFSFISKIKQGSENTLHCIYWGEDNRGRAFDILIDGELLASVELVIYKGSKFHEITYPIPPSLTEGKTEVKIAFQAKENNIVGPVYGIRMLGN